MADTQNITLSLPKHLIHFLRIAAAQGNSSASKLIAEMIEFSRKKKKHGTRETEVKKMEKQVDQIIKKMIRQFDSMNKRIETSLRNIARIESPEFKEKVLEEMKRGLR